MLLLKVNPELKKVFSRLIGSIGAPVTWKNVIAVVNNNLILVGEVRSLIFNFENKKVYTNIIDIPLENKVIDRIPNDMMINNMINMTLYAFGKWGSIGGLKVDKDYATLNTLFQNVFRAIGVEPGFRSENFRFYKNGIQITYEEVIAAAMRLLKAEGKVQSEVESEEEKAAAEERDREKDASEYADAGEEKRRGDIAEGEEAESEEEQDEGEATQNDGEDWLEDEDELGLWHNLCWKIKSCSFVRGQKSESDVIKSRIGNDFYMTDYQCPECGEKLYMGVYPENREIRIETEEARVFMTRTYACHSCNMFFTPRPGKLLQEGDVYFLDFEEDRIAYEDYLTLLGERAAKTTNYRMNEYEFQRKTGNMEAEKTRMVGEVSGESYAQGREPFGKEDIDKENIGKEDIDRTQERGEKALLHNDSSKHQFEKKQEKQRKAEGEEPELQKKSPAVLERAKAKLEVKTTEELKAHVKMLETGESGGETNAQGAGSYTMAQKPEELSETEYMEVVCETLRDKLTAKYDARMGALTNLSFRQLSELKRQLQGEEVLPEEAKNSYIAQVDSRLYAAEEKALEQKIELSKNKTYEEINRIIEEVGRGDSPEALKRDTIEKLKRIRSDRAEREVEHLIFHIPLHLDRKQLAVYLDKLEQYKEVDMSPYRKRLEERRNMAEKEEIAAFVKRGGKKDRQALWELYGQLKEQDYKEENKEPFLEKIYDKVRKMDEEEIEEICPSIATMSFAEGMEAYQKISEMMLLPELKTNTLEMIERRITKLKTDESVQLMRKLKREMEEKMADLQGFYFYDAREEMRRERAEGRVREEHLEENSEREQEAHREAMLRAIHGYGAGREPYEYPILVGDTTKNESGKEGFVLTPEHLFYHSLFSSGVINIWDIDKVEESRGFVGKGINVKRFVGKKGKLPTPVKPEERSVFAEILHEFVKYLQERPESRRVEYLSKEKHEVKCCYRCGFTYKGGNVCPKCGSKMNN